MPIPHMCCRELCGILKKGQPLVTLSALEIAKGAKIINERAVAVHQLISNALNHLNVVCAEARKQRLVMLQQKQWVERSRDTGKEPQAVNPLLSSALDVNDPILAWGSIHQAVASKSIQEMDTH